MADAINAKSDVLGERELDAVSGGMSVAPFVAVVDLFIKVAGGGTSGGGTSGGGTSGGGQSDPLQQLFQQLLHQG
jgi:uncharacterized membrane protein